MADHNTRVFGTDGVRGKANHYPMNVETALSLGRAVGKILRRNSKRCRVVIGKDTRLSCYMFESALIAGFCSMGIDTLVLGPFPTPGVAFITRAYRADAGVVISASHNPFFDNGIKFFSSEGYKFPDSWEREVEALVALQHFDDALPLDQELGRNAKVSDADGRYIEFAKATFPRKLSLKTLRIVLDCANGAAYKVAPLVLRELDAEVFVYGNTPNGLNINQQVGALFPETAQKAVIDTHAHVGIALDGDGDRIIMIDEHAQIIDGDTILAICAHDLLKKGLLKNKRVVTTVMSNLGTIHALQGMGVEVVRSAVGDRYVIQEMIKADAVLGGEPSGHVIFLDYNPTGDGLVSALQVLRIMIETGSSLSDLAQIVKKYPQVLVNVEVHQKIPLEKLPQVTAEIARVEGLLKDQGRVLVRYSGTENLCRIMIEGPKLKFIQECAQSIAKVLESEIGAGK